MIEDAEDEAEGDTSSEGQQEAIDQTRVAAEDNMVEVSDQGCAVINLCEIATQTSATEMASVAVTAKPPTPPALLECGSQTYVVRH